MLYKWLSDVSHFPPYVLNRVVSCNKLSESHNCLPNKNILNNCSPIVFDFLLSTKSKKEILPLDYNLLAISTINVLTGSVFLGTSGLIVEPAS